MNETERDILYEIRNIYVGGDGIILPRERLGVVVGYMVELEMRIRDLTTERDAAHEKIVSFGSTMADLIMLRSENTRLEAETIESAAILEKAVKESKAIVAGYNRAIEERDAARDKINMIVAWAESCEESANNPDVDADVAHDRKESVRDIYRLLGIESEASE